MAPPHLLGSKLLHLYDTNIADSFYDVTLILSEDDHKDSEKVEIRCHKFVLAAWSRVFAAMFSSGMKEQNGHEVEIKDVNPVAMQNLVRYCYSEDLQIEPCNALEILQAADRFHIKSAVSLCEHAMQEAITPQTCWAWLAAASVHHFESLLEHCKDFICRNFSDLITMDHFLEADADQLMDILDNDGIVCLNEFQIFKAAMNWIAHSPTVRAAHVPRLLDTIRFSNMSEGDLTEAQENPVASGYPCFWRKVAEGYKGICQKEHARPRRYEETLKGVLLSVPIDIIEGAGWRKVMVEAYSHKTSLAELEDCTSYREAGREDKVPYKYIIVGARENTAPRLSLCALGRTQTVLKRTEGNNTVLENGVYWYCNPDKSFGFAPTPNVFLNSSDVMEDDAVKSLRWRLDKFPGERAGKHKGLFSSTMAEIWTKVVYAATSLDNVVELCKRVANMSERTSPRTVKNPHEYMWDQYGSGPF